MFCTEFVVLPTVFCTEFVVLPTVFCTEFVAFPFAVQQYDVQNVPNNNFASRHVSVEFNP